MDIEIKEYRPIFAFRDGACTSRPCFSGVKLRERQSLLTSMPTSRWSSVQALDSHVPEPERRVLVRVTETCARLAGRCVANLHSDGVCVMRSEHHRAELQFCLRRIPHYVILRAPGVPFLGIGLASTSTSSFTMWNSSAFTPSQRG